MAGRLTGKVAVITGTAGGQGRAGALRFAQEGARIVGCDLDRAGAEETVRLVRQAGGEMVSLAPIDLADEAAVEAFIAFAVEAFGDFDILWNNASALRMGPLDGHTLADFEFTLTNEVTIIFVAVKHALDVFRRRGGGVILNTASVSGGVGSGFVGNLPGLLAHGAAKAAVARLTTALAVELAPIGVRVNGISPGIIQTPPTLPLVGTEEAPGPLRRAFEEMSLVERIGTPDDVVNAALFLASDEAGFVTGADLAVDGGWSASGGAGRARTDLGEAMAQLMAGAA